MSNENITPEQMKKRQDELYQRANDIANGMNQLFEGEHIECIGNAQLIIIAQYISVIPPEAREIFINGVMKTINDIQHELNKAKH